MSTYCTRANIEDIFGVENVAKYADLDSDASSSKITNRIARAIAIVGEEIDDLFRGTHYRIPVQDASGDTPTSIESLAAHLAGLWLYEARGGVDMDREGGLVHRWQHLRTWADRVIGDIRTGVRKIDAV